MAIQGVCNIELENAPTIVSKLEKTLHCLRKPCLKAKTEWEWRGEMKKKRGRWRNNNILSHTKGLGGNSTP